MNPDQLPETRAARRFRQFFEERGKAEGLAEGKREGLAEGKREGLAEGKRAALLKVLEARGLSVSHADRATIAACGDASLLDAWLVRATAAGSTGEVLGRANGESRSGT